MNQLRSDNMIYMKKNYKKKLLLWGSFLSLSSAPYQLSVTFSHKFLSRYQYDIFSQSWQMIKELAKGHSMQRGNRFYFTIEERRIKNVYLPQPLR